MKASILFGSAAVYLSGVCLAVASPCSDRFTAIEAKIKQKSEAAISASSGGKGVAASREARAMQDVDKPPQPFQSEQKAAEDQEKADAAGDAGDNVLQAQVALRRARQMDAEGNIQGCQEALAEAETKLAAQD